MLLKKKVLSHQTKVNLSTSSRWCAATLQVTVMTMIAASKEAEGMPGCCSDFFVLFHFFLFATATTEHDKVQVFERLSLFGFREGLGSGAFRSD